MNSSKKLLETLSKLKEDDISNLNDILTKNSIENIIDTFSE